MRARLEFGLIVLLLCAPLSALAQPAIVEGRVQGDGGAGEPYANVRLEHSTIGAVTDGQGRFRCTAERRGGATLRTTAVGYQSATRRVRLRPDDTTTVRLTLRPARVQLGKTVVTGETYSTGPGADVMLSSVEAVTTPGVQGDLFRTLQSFPGVTAPGDGAGLFVRV